jgi:hypothetical protein
MMSMVAVAAVALWAYRTSERWWYCRTYYDRCVLYEAVCINRARQINEFAIAVEAETELPPDRRRNHGYFIGAWYSKVSGYRGADSVESMRSEIAKARAEATVWKNRAPVYNRLARQFGYAALRPWAPVPPRPLDPDRLPDE